MGLSGFYSLLGREPYWKLPSYCLSPCVYVKLEELQEVQNSMNDGMYGDFNEIYIKKLNRLQKYCFKRSRESDAVCASEFFPGGLGGMGGYGGYGGYGSGDYGSGDYGSGSYGSGDYGSGNFGSGSGYGSGYFSTGYPGGSGEQGYGSGSGSGYFSTGYPGGSGEQGGNSPTAGGPG